MESTLQLLYDSIYPHLDVNPHYRDAERQWEKWSAPLSPDVVDAAELLLYEWGFACFAAGLKFQGKLNQELG